MLDPSNDACLPLNCGGYWTFLISRLDTTPTPTHPHTLPSPHRTILVEFFLLLGVFLNYILYLSEGTIPALSTEDSLTV